MQVSTLLITPICPHTCDHIWRNILRRQGSALTAGFPVGGEPDFEIRCACRMRRLQHECHCLLLVHC